MSTSSSCYTAIPESAVRAGLSAIAEWASCLFLLLAIADLLKDPVEMFAVHNVRRIYPELGGSIYTADTQASAAGEAEGKHRVPWFGQT